MEDGTRGRVLQAKCSKERRFFSSSFLSLSLLICALEVKPVFSGASWNLVFVFI